MKNKVLVGIFSVACLFSFNLHSAESNKQVPLDKHIKMQISNSSETVKTAAKKCRGRTCVRINR